MVLGAQVSIRESRASRRARELADAAALDRYTNCYVPKGPLALKVMHDYVVRISTALLLDAKLGADLGHTRPLLMAITKPAKNGVRARQLHPGRI